VISSAMPQLRERIKNYRDVQGTLTARLGIATGGAVGSIDVLTDNLVTAMSGYDQSEAVNSVRSLIQQTLKTLQFPSTPGGSVIIVPILVPLPDLTPIEFVIPHRASAEAVQERLARRIEDMQMLDLRGAWDGMTFAVREPIAGLVRVEPGQLAIVFEPPMWVPSQREHFQRALSEWGSDIAT
jgi:hypothetical protein